MERRYNEKLEDYENQIIDLQARINNIDDKIIDPTKMQMSLDEFLNLANSAVDKMKAGTAVEKDELCRILFLNLVFDHEKGASFPWKEPFSMLVNRHSVKRGGEKVILLEPPDVLVVAIYNATLLSNFTIPTLPQSSQCNNRGVIDYRM